MNLRQTQFLVLGAGLALACFGAAAQSGGSLSRVEVTGHPLTPVTRVDVHATCLHIDQQLQDSLGVAVYRAGKAGDMKVSFELQGNQMIAIHVNGGPLEYYQAVRRAVADLSCQNGGAAQNYSFTVALRPYDEDSEQGQHSVALVDQ